MYEKTNKCIEITVLCYLNNCKQMLNGCLPETVNKAASYIFFKL